MFFIQARNGSSRLPKKVLLPFFNEESILDIIASKLKNNFEKIPIVICTSTNILDDEIENFCKQKNILCFRGNENNVLKRFIDASNHFNVNQVIRICADNPFLDIHFLKELIKIHQENKNFDYWSFKNSDNIPVIKTHFGFFAEIVSVNSLKKVSELTKDSLFLEHVTNYIYSHYEFNFFLKELPQYLSNRKDLRFTIDDETDFENLKEVYKKYVKFNYNIEKTILYIDNKKEIINKMISNIKKYSK